MKYPWKNLVFEGGGIKAIAYTGALKILELKGITNNIERVAGSSAGSLIALMMALKYSSDEILDVLLNTDFSRIGESDFFVEDWHRLVTSYGLYESTYLQKIIEGIIEKKTGKKDITFIELRKSYLDLYILVTNLEKKQSEALSAKKNPNLSVCQSLLASMAVPFYFVPQKINNSIYVDGGMLRGYPIDLFDNRDFIDSEYCQIDYYEKVNKECSLDYVYNKETIGLRLDSLLEINHYKKNIVPSFKINSFVDYTKTLLKVLLNHDENRHLHSHDGQRSIYIDTLDVSTLDFSLDQEKISKLIRSGEISAGRYLSWWQDIAKRKLPMNQIEENLESVWNKLVYFHKEENWGNWKKIKPLLLVRLEALRENLGEKVAILAGTQNHCGEGHNGLSVDVSFPEGKKDLMDLYFAVETFGFTGIGILIEDNKFSGMHLDLNPLKKNTPAKRWIQNLGQKLPLKTKYLEKYLYPSEHNF